MKNQDDSLNHAMIEFYEKLSSWEMAVVKDKGFSLPQVHTVEILGLNGPMRMKELAQKIGITTGTLTVQIDKMVDAGLVVRVPHANDRRSILIELTESGQQMFAEHDKLHMQLTHDLTAKFDDSERTMLLDFFERINKEF
ncbi:MarR family winged helix-turn-helix transcriptional regulator [Shewanella fidelis]|uniref:MarR family transcriptional regulator n=1 Tax=Shewanella fidelis TaxID=173509 RepID=A0AAW8NPH4_9GAMM|nr:MarR family transcriptional regulator [Shewanella fidelis]MDR8523699.1 MarR family transcriptional regulator [Shewanella fidelis]MDW4810246.1 MarR family transcriptional regulator [Shewanella fidelis]MDW4814391.1 MarR family transcriptional regulator [Shewanella fidelis]MDW4818482.1 MarR family transcriptional regulator [Shewanella fidelis]MDW4823866.1 MarR family transcriptional regulator [Shewanella fidelis]